MEHISDVIEKADIVPIKTTYNGVEFRSRLEARWAVFLDALGIEWLYEYEGFELPSGRYLPDFWLPKIQGGTWLEIKPESESFSGARANRLCAELCEATGRPVVMSNGMPDDPVDDYGMSKWGVCSDGLVNEDEYQYMCQCGECGAFGIEFGARGQRVCGNECYPGEDRGYGITPRIESAIWEAKRAKFW